MLSRELHATFLGMHPLGSIAPDQNGCIATDEVHDPIATSDSADRRQGQLGSRQQVRYYAPRHRPEASHNASHRSAVSIRPQ